MRNFLLSLMMLCSTLMFGQIDSWIHVQLMTDDYPDETTWTITPPGGSPIILQNESNMLPNTLYDTIIPIQGTFIASIYDQYGDGLSSAPFGGTDGWFMISNSCQDTLMYTAGNFGDTLVETLTTAPCAPPTGGCMDPNSSNYDSTAYFDDGSCTYSVDFVLDMNVYPDTFTTPYVAGTFNGWTDQHPLSDPDGDGIWEATLDLQPGQYLWKYMLDNWADQELPQLGPNTGCFLPDGNGFINRTLEVIDTSISLPPVCWESCLPCGAILGCMNPLSDNFNPWANIDDGSCIIDTGCGPDQTSIEIQFTPDNYPSESGFKLYGDAGLVLEVLPGDLTGSTPGVPISYYACVDTGELYDIVIEDTYGDGLCGTCFGGTVNGNLVVIDCDDNELFNLQDTVPDGNFNYLFTTPQFEPAVCTTVAPIAGCMNPFSTTFNPLAVVDDGTCGPPRVQGCTDSTAFNYDPNANTSEVIQGQYTLEIFDGASDGWGGTWLGLKQGNWISPQYQIGPQDGNSISFQVNLNIYQPVYAYLFTTPQSITSINQVGYKLTGPGGDVIIDVAYWDALPFPFVLESDTLPTFGSTCVPVILGCTDSTSFNYIQPTGDPMVDVNTDDGSCIPVVMGCTNPLAFNYDPQANTDDGSCVATVYGCMDPNAYNYNPNANISDGNCIYLGCTDSTACNFDSTANVDNGGCTYAAQYYDCNNVCINDTDGDGVCDELEIAGCTDPLSINFNPQATDDDGSCIPIVYGCTDTAAFNYNPQANTDDGSCIPIVLGCTDPTSFNYDPNANTDDGSCVPVIFGCTDPTAFNYDSTANTDNGSCIPVILGCTDTTAFNYNPLANTDDGSCYGEILGCLDPTAYNFNDYDGDGIANILTGNPQIDINTSDSSCLYDAGCITGPGNPYWLNDQCYAWVIDVDAYCCENEWDAICQEMYNYCEDGWPEGMDIWESKRLTTQIAIYPNPTKNVLNIVSELDNVEHVLYDLTGKILIGRSNGNQVDLTRFANGVYLLEIWHDGKFYRNKIIKE